MAVTLTFTPAALSADVPSLFWMSDRAQTTPSFRVYLVAPANGDSLELQRAASSGFGTITETYDGVVSGTGADLDIGTVANGSWYWRIRHKGGSWSPTVLTQISAVL